MYGQSGYFMQNYNPYAVQGVPDMLAQAKMPYQQPARLALYRWRSKKMERLCRMLLQQLFLRRLVTSSTFLCQHLFLFPAVVA